MHFVLIPGDSVKITLWCSVTIQSGIQRVGEWLAARRALSHCLGGLDAVFARVRMQSGALAR